MKSLDEWTEGLSKRIVRGMKGFDQWTEGLSKQIIVQGEEGSMMAPWKSNRMSFVDDGSEEEEL